MQMVAYDCFILLLINWNWRRLCCHMLYWTHTRTHTSIPFNVCCHLFHLFFILFDSVHICPHSTSEINGKGSSFIMVRFIGFPKCFNNKSHSLESMPSQIDIVLQWLLVLGCLHLQYFLLHCVPVLLAYSNTTHTTIYSYSLLFLFELFNL